MRRFTQVDVFSDQLMYGNPVAVVHEADDLTTQDMADFARWTNLSETTFLSAPTDDSADYRLRIFTTRRELPFAGHPTLGSARAWLDAGGVAKNPEWLVQQCEAGLVRIRKDGARLAFEAPPLIRGGNVEADDLTELMAFLAISRDLIMDAQWVDNGPGWVGLLLTDAERVLALHPRADYAGRFNSVGVIGPYPPQSEVDFEVRAFTPQEGLGEDPVTGSLNASLAGWLIGTGQAPSSYVAAQGTAMGRRGRVHISKVGDQVWVGGDTVIGVIGTVQL